VTSIPTEDPPRRFVGIDLGTTNSALAWSGPRGTITLLDVAQLDAAGENARYPTLPSFLYFPTDAERHVLSGGRDTDPVPPVVAGVYARDHGALVPGRQIASAKSWLVNPSVDRTAAILPFGVDDGPRLSPVAASAHLLRHLYAVWTADERTRVAVPDEPSIVLTVPASFDEEARELTVQAAVSAELPRLTLLEEPIAALYAWIAVHRRAAFEAFEDGALVLVCDVGGGTTDFSLIRATSGAEGVTFERVAIGEHLLLGGDNLDLALAALVEQRLGEQGSGRLSLTQRLTLRRKCSAAKEHLLSSTDERVRITVLGSGRGVVAGGMSVDLTRAETLRTLLEGFLPLSAADDLPSRDRRVGLRELGLPYETEPAITRHLAAFLTRASRHAGTGMARPSAVLFNGGFFTPALARERVLDALESWFATRPAELVNERPEAAVALGAAFYARLRSNPEAARLLLIRAGSARAYYVGLQAGADDAATTAVCVLPRGTQEGTTFELDRSFIVTTNQPIGFTLYSSTARNDAVDDVVSFTDRDEVRALPPLMTVLRYGKRSRRVPLGVRLRVSFTETGTLELWCESRESDHRWRLAFSLRGADDDALSLDTASPGAGAAGGDDAALVSSEAMARAAELIRSVFVPAAAGAHGVTPEALVGELEAATGFGKQAWPLGTIRQIADMLLEVAAGRAASPTHEVRWLNLTGFCVRPGFGATTDPWRISELRKVYAAGLVFPKDTQCQVEWLVLWQRAGAGFTAGHQRELAQRVAAQLGVGQKKPPRINAQIEREGWRLLASLERLDSGQRARLGDAMIERLRRDARNRSWLWAIGRFGARVPLYGPLSSTVAPAVAERWIDALLARPLSADSAAAVVQLGARTDDPARDIGDDTRARALAALQAAAIPAETGKALVSVVPADRVDLAQAFGEALPAGLRLE
jgi:molecular chaperone DnaK (HSP70)